MFSEFDEDDPLAGILSDSDLDQSTQVAKKPVFRRQKSVDESIKPKDTGKYILYFSTYYLSKKYDKNCMWHITVL